MSQDEAVNELPGAYAVADFVAAGLYDETAPDADDRLALLQHLAAEGASIEEMQGADQESALTWLGVDRMLAIADGQPIEEVARRTGLSEEIISRVQRSMALPTHDEAVYSPTNLRVFAAAADLFGVDATLQFSRVIGASLSRIVDAAVSVFLTEIRAPLHEEHAPPVERARQGEGATRLLLELPDLVRAIWPDYVADGVRRYRHTDVQSTGGVRAAVGFVDLVDSTRLVQQLPPRDLARAIGEFESAATHLAHTHRGRIIKFIGDAAMFVAPDPADSCAIALELCETVQDHPVLTAARGAIGFGNVVAQDGDLYGPVVNLASRLASVADPGQILGTPDLQAAAEGQQAPYRFEDVGSHRLRGFDEPCRALAIVRVG